MTPFKFLRNPIIKAHDGGNIYAGETFFTMNKEEYESVRPGRIIAKYTIVRRYVPKKYQDVFKPDYNALWYFRSKQNAEYLRTLWENDDRIQEADGEIFHRQSDITLTFSRD